MTQDSHDRSTRLNWGRLFRGVNSVSSPLIVVAGFAQSSSLGRADEIKVGLATPMQRKPKNRLQPAASSPTTSPCRSKHKPAPSGKPAERRKGNIARLPKALRDKVNQMLQDGLPCSCRNTARLAPSASSD